MNAFKQFLLKASAYTVVILSAFYIYGGIAGITEHGISWHKYLLILGYGLLISTAEIISGILVKHRVLANLINYAVLLSGFIIIFVLSTNTTGSVATKIFIAVALFTVIYVLIRLCIYLIKKAISKSSIVKKQPVKPETKKKSAYRSLYGDN